MKPTICLNCKHCLNTSRPSKDTIWYDLYCKASPLPPTIDYTTGKRQDGYEFCRDINTNGKCKKYEEK